MKRFFQNTGNLIIAGFVLFALGILLVSYRAMNIPTDMAVEGDYYEKEAAFNDQLIAQRAAEVAFGKALFLDLNGEALALHIPETAAKNLQEGSVEFFCLSDSQSDRKFKLEPGTEGIYHFLRKEAAPGKNYIARVSFKVGQVSYYKEFKFL